MNIFRTYAYTWWQIGLFKLALLCIGAAIGAYWHAVFLPYVAALAAMGIALSVYIAVVSFRKQANPAKPH